MKESPEVKAARSLKKEYDMWMKYAGSATQPIEAEYYRNMANNTGAWIDWDLLNKKKKEAEPSLEERYMV